MNTERCNVFANNEVLLSAKFACLSSLVKGYCVTVVKSGGLQEKQRNGRRTYVVCIYKENCLRNTSNYVLF